MNLASYRLALCLVCVLCYFSYHLVQGNRGLLAWNEAKVELAEATQQLKSLQDQQERLSVRVRLLRRDNLDLDMLDEQARRLLGYVRSDEAVLLWPAAIPR